MKHLLSILFLSVLCSSCQKELQLEAVPAIRDTLVINNVKDTSWQPLSKNSYWKYKANSNAGEITILTSTGTTELIKGKPFNVFSVEKTGQLPGKAYFSKENNRYELQEIFTRMDIVSPRVYAGFVYLVDNNAKTGDTWEYDAGIATNNQPSKIKGEVQSTSITILVAGITYKNVLLTKLEVLYKLDAQSGYENFQSYYFYLARGIGIIRTDAFSTGGGPNSFNVTEELFDYKIY